jgi:phage shock protein PspC (stress-responsive transcriptional regulator)
MSMSNELERLAELHRNGQLSDAEYSQAKARVLGSATGSDSGGDDAASAVNSFRRSRSDRWLGGVCAGLGRLTGLESWIWRLGFVLMAICAGTGVLAYLLLWIFVPEE